MIVREGVNSPIAIVSYGSVLTESLLAAKQLAEEGIEVDVINARFASPIYEKIISLLEEGRGIITVEEHSVACGFGSAVLETASSKFGGIFPNPIRVLGAPKRFIKQGSRKEQLSDIGVNAERIVRESKEMLSFVKYR